ncbi:unnamed protein product [Hermetia illucens]|uniref:Ionotropic receptor n=1 Tax=Hermetia illucens TaxID=343691 RepID=A0A7R8YT81_HERIL|nr:unnamed protein product [Hermetia illucens]
MLANESVNFVRCLISLIIQRHFAALHTVLIVYNSANMTRLQLSYLDGVTEGIAKLVQDNKIIYTWMDVAELDAEDFDNSIYNNADIGTQGYICLLPNTTAFISAKYNATQRSMLRQNDRVILMLTENESPHVVLSSPHLSLYPRHLLIVPRNSTHLEFWTQQYNGIGGNYQATLLATFKTNDSSLNLESLLPDKLKDLKGKHLKVSSITYLPYTISYPAGNGTGMVEGLNTNGKTVFYEGTEGLLVREFCKVRNCTLKVKPHGPDGWGGIYENGSSDGLIGSVYTMETEFGIGCIYNWYSEELDVSRTIYKSAVTLLVPAPSLLPPYLTPVLPFSSTIWIIVIISIIITSMAFHLLNVFGIRDPFKAYKKRSFVFSTLGIVAIFFQQSFLKGRFTRPYIICLLFASMILEITYTSRFKAQMTIPQYTGLIDSSLQFVESNLKWSAPANAWILTIAESQIPFEHTLVNNFEIKSYSEMRNLTFSRKYGFGVERLSSGLYSFGPYIQEDALDYLHVINDNLFFDYTRAISIRGWPLMPSFDELVSHAFEHGLLYAWERKFVRKYLDPSTEERLLLYRNGLRNRFLKSEPTVLNEKHVSGLFFLLLLGYVLGLTCFVCELIIFNCKNTSKHFSATKSKKKKPTNYFNRSY